MKLNTFCKTTHFLPAISKQFLSLPIGKFYTWLIFLHNQRLWWLWQLSGVIPHHLVSDAIGWDFQIIISKSIVIAFTVMIVFVYVQWPDFLWSIFVFRRQQHFKICRDFHFYIVQWPNRLWFVFEFMRLRPHLKICACPDLYFCIVQWPNLFWFVFVFMRRPHFKICVTSNWPSGHFVPYCPFFAITLLLNEIQIQYMAITKIFHLQYKYYRMRCKSLIKHSFCL